MAKQTNTFLFVPNIIDYFRVLALLGVCFYANSSPILTIVLYAVSQILDAFDGMFARKLNQCNEFGKVLDMVCDRASDAIFLAILAGRYPTISYVFLIALLLDLSSHWYQTYSTQYCQEEHHKTAKTNWKILHIYYNAKLFLFWMVVGYELFLLNMYLKSFEQELDIPDFYKVFNTSLLYISGPIFLLKNYISLIQLFSASEKIVNAENEYKRIASQKQK